MTVERKADENGAVTEIIVMTKEENAAIGRAHKIVAERYKQLGMEQTAWEKEHLEYALQGKLRFDGKKCFAGRIQQRSSKEKAVPYAGTAD